MASQMAQIINQYRQTMPTGGLEKAAEGFFRMKEMGEKSQLRKLKTDAAKIELFDKKYYGGIAAADTNEKWLSGQQADFIPKNMEFKDREPYLMSKIAQQAYDAKSTAGSEERAFNALISEMTPEEQEKAKKIKAGLEPRATGSAAITTATSGLTDVVAESEAKIAEQKAKKTEQAKADVKLTMGPKIESAIAEARKLATDRGEAFTALNQAKAALPGLQEVTTKLKSLADVATYTKGGQLFDTAAKELGFGATKGATARTKMQSLVDNQVLPLLKQTFGAAFTVEEGRSLRATMMDIDKTPEEKKATLDSFIENKIREIETKERVLSPDVKVIRFDEQGNMIP